MKNHFNYSFKYRSVTALLLLSLLSFTGCEANTTEPPAPLYEIAPDVILNRIQADIEADELTQTEHICQLIADQCADLYQSAEKEPSMYMPDQLALTQTTIDAMEQRLVEQGYTVLDTDQQYPSFLQNEDDIKQFWNAVQDQTDARQDYIWISPYGGFHYCLLEYRNGEPFFLEAAVQ